MKKSLLILLVFLISFKATACSCKWGGNFLRIAIYSELIIKGKVIEHVYHTEDGKRYKNQEEFAQAQLNNDFDEYYGTGESIRVEIIELIKGTEKRKIIEIFDSDGADCRMDVGGFESGKTYIFGIYKPKRTGVKLPNETENDYAIMGCYESTLEYNSQTNQVYGLIKGKTYRRKKINYSYEKLIRKITKHNKVYN